MPVFFAADVGFMRLNNRVLTPPPPPPPLSAAKAGRNHLNE
jgi:hypothetical protein